MTFPEEIPEEIFGEPPEQFRDAYEPSRYDASKYRLTSQAKDYIASRESELRALEAQAEMDLATERRAHQETKEKLRTTIISQALERALVAAGADPSKRHGAVALLMSTWKFTVEGDDVAVRFDNADGEMDLFQAVSRWLANDGEAFAQRQQSTDALSRIQQLTRRR
jgi:hypothetical protein